MQAFERRTVLKFFAALVTANALPAHAAAKTAPVILDVDTGRDDAWALIAAFNTHTRLDSVIASYGNTSRDNAVQNTLDVLKLAAHQTRTALPPMWVGERGPITTNTENTAEINRRANAGHNGLFNVAITHAKQPAIIKGPDWEYAFCEYLKKLARTQGPVDYICCGPLTDLAEIIKAAGPDVTKYLGRVIAVGGSLEVGTKPDFNFMADPTAAELVLNTFGPRLTIVPYDDTRTLVMTSREITALPANTPTRRFTRDVMAAHAASIPEHVSRLHDPTALLALQHGLPTSTIRVRVKTDLPDAGKLIPDANGIEITRTHIDAARIPAVKTRVLNMILK